MIIEIIKYLFFGIYAGIDMFLKLLPFYEQLSNVNAQLIVSLIGIPPIVALLISFFVKICSNFNKNH